MCVCVGGGGGGERGEEVLLNFCSSKTLQRFWSAAEMQTVSQRPSWCQMKLVATLHDLMKNKFFY